MAKKSKRRFKARVGLYLSTYNFESFEQTSFGKQFSTSKVNTISIRIFLQISFAVLVACIVAIQAEPVQYPPVAPSLTEPKVESSVTPANLEKDGSNRDKKHAICK